MIEKISIEALINLIPGYFGIVDLESKFSLVNKTGSEWMGYQSTDQLIGDCYENIYCKAAEDYKLFLEQDKITLSRGYIRFLGYYCYSGDNWKIVHGEKFLLRNKNNKPTGLVCRFNDYAKANLFDISRFLISSNNRYRCGKNNNQFCVLIEDETETTMFNTKELECIFFLLRGKTAKLIAKKLYLSPRTVEERIDNIKEKLGCHSKSELIEKAISLGFFNTIPDSLIHSNINAKLLPGCLSKPTIENIMADRIFK